MSESSPVDPYKPPLAEAASGQSNPQTIARGSGVARAWEFVSPSGSFSRVELLIATVVLLGVGMGLSVLHTLFPAVLSATGLTVARYGLYLIWGAALGKRSRDLGTTFTYGMVVGVLFPVLGLIFLFQEGAKGRAGR